ncbi:MAG: hypothetical protein J1E16_01520 [Muribaculaceae bacterium]|nr:hypothetical protein [Muribaculaceae bacterium]
MKKFTTIGAALLLGGFGFSANATLTPSEITPESGEVINGWAEDIMITWGEEQDVQIDYSKQIMISYNGGEPEAIYAVDFYDIGGDFDEELDAYVPAPPYVLVISWSSYTDSEDGIKTGKYTITIPAGFVQDAENTADVNDEIVLEYTYVGAWGDYTIDPNPVDNVYGSSALSNVTVTWKNTPFISYNKELEIICEKEGATGGDDFGPGGRAVAEPVTDGVLNPELVTVNEEEGTIVLDLSGLGEGTWHVEIPSGYVAFDEYTVSSSVQMNYVIFNGLSSATVLSPENDQVTVLNSVDLTWNYETVYPTEKGLSATIQYNDEEWNTQTIQVPASAFNFITVNNEETGGIDPQADELAGNIVIINVESLLEGISGFITVIIPEGIVANEEGLINPSQEIQVNIMPLAEEDATILIEDNNILVYWEGYSLSAPNPCPIYIENAEGEKITLNYEDTDLFGNFVPGEITIVNYEQFVINLEDLDLEGEYTLIIPSESIPLSGANYQNYLNAEVTFEFNVTDGEISAVTPDEEPAYMTAEPTLYYDADPMMPVVYVYWSEDVDTLTDNNSVLGNLTVPAKDEEGENLVVAVELGLTVYGTSGNEAAPTEASDFTSGSNALILNMSEYIAEYGEGEYTLSIGTVVRNSEGALNMPFEESFTVEALPQVTEVEATLTYEEVNTLVISWNNEAVSLMDVAAEVLILSPTDAEFEERLSIGDGVKVNENNVTVNLEGLDLTTGGKYTVTIGEGAFYIGKDKAYYNDVVEFEFIYGSTGINAIESANGVVEGVYNLQGVKMNKDLNSLAPGLYIINGKKVLVRK